MQRCPIYRFSYGFLFAALIGTILPVSTAIGKAENTLKPIRTGSFAGAYLAGRVAGADNDLDTAVRYYKQALIFDPGNALIKQNLLIALLADGKFQDVLPLAAGLKNDPHIERFSRVSLAINAISHKQYRQAKLLLILSAQSDMEQLMTGLISAWASFGDRRVQEALNVIRQINGPEWYNLFKTYNLALIADAAGDKKAARDFYQQAIDDWNGGRAAPDTYERITEAYALFKMRNGEKDEAITLLKKVEELLSGRLVLQKLREKIDKGGKFKALITTPQQGAAEVLYILGTAINRGGAEGFARLYLQMSLPLRFEHDATLFQLGNIAEKLNQSEKAIEYYGRVPKNSVYQRDAKLHLALNLAEMNRTDDALQTLKVLIEENKQDIRPYLILGKIYAQKKDFRNAADIYDTVVDIVTVPKHEDWVLFYERGITYERLKEWDKAEPNFRKALELYPDQPQVLNYLGYSWIERGIHLEEALDMIHKAVGLSPQDGYVIDSLGWAYYRLGRYDEAVEELEKAVKLGPEDATLNDHLGDAYWRVGRKLEAVFQWKHAIVAKPEPEELTKIENKLKKGLPNILEPIQNNTDHFKPQTQ